MASKSGPRKEMSNNQSEPKTIASILLPDGESISTQQAMEPLSFFPSVTIFMILRRAGLKRGKNMFRYLLC
jgi:hypothetical protein